MQNSYQPMSLSDQLYQYNPTGSYKDNPNFLGSGTGISAGGALSGLGTTNGATSGMMSEGGAAVSKALGLGTNPNMMGKALAGAYAGTKDKEYDWGTFTAQPKLNYSMEQSNPMTSGGSNQMYMAMQQYANSLPTKMQYPSYTGAR